MSGRIGGETGGDRNFAVAFPFPAAGDVFSISPGPADICSITGLNKGGDVFRRAVVGRP